MKKTTFIIAVAFALMLVGCKSLKQSLFAPYERPDVNTTGLIRDVVSNTDTLVSNADTNFGNLPWREVFTDPQLQV
ncbi:MAG: TolC family protein, partial [Prevotella sp.]|nr:TolC family protein [Prevotella sp.]